MILGINNELKKIILATIDIKIIDMYSARNTITKGTEEYSVLKPDTSSLSPSAKSKGERFASARIIIKKITEHIGIITQVGNHLLFVNDKLEKITLDNKNNLKHTSYEIVWATARIAPKFLYLEFDLYPTPSVPYTPNEENARNIITEITELKLLKSDGYITHINEGTKKTINNTNENNPRLAILGQLFSFIKSLIASAKGTHTPSGPGLFGPLRKWWYPRILRSINVKNATAIKTAINW